MRRNASPPVAPPVVPPPVVADRTDHPSVINNARRESRWASSQVVLPSAIGIGCLVIGLAVGQWGKLDQRAVTAADSLAPSIHHSASTASLRLAAEAPLEDTPAAVQTDDEIANPQPVDESIPAVEEVAQRQSVETVVPAVAPAAQASADEVADSWSEWSDKQHSAKPGLLDLQAATTHAADAEDPNCQSGQCQVSPRKQDANQLGTLVHWAEKPEQAFRLARDEDKLVFLIHVSGNFEIPGFT